MEIFGPTHRSAAAFTAFSVGVLGESVLAVIAMNTLNWRTMVKISSFAPLFVIFYGWIIPESSRWLLVKNKIEKLNANFNKMAKTNGVEFKSNFSINNIKSKDCPKQEAKESFFKLFESSAMKKRVIVCAYCWITCVFVFYGITLGSVTIFGNMYLNFIMVALMEVPGNIASLVCANYFGRKNTLICSYLLAGMSCIAFTLITEEGWIKLATFMVGKAAITCAFQVVYIFTTELFPTPFRQRTMGICSSIGRIGSISAPQMPFLAKIWTPLPFLTFGSMAIIAGALALTYPETLGTKLPDTIEEALALGKKNNNSEVPKPS